MKALFHLGIVCGGVMVSILSRRTDGIRLPAQLPWLVPALIYCFFLQFTAVRSTVLFSQLVSAPLRQILSRQIFCRHAELSAGATMLPPCQPMRVVKQQPGLMMQMLRRWMWWSMHS